MEIKKHTILRQTQFSPRPTETRQHTSDAPKDSFQSQSPDPNFPDISGLAAFSRTQFLAVKDSKLESETKRLALLDSQTGKAQDLDIDWTATGRARDLEAITPTGKPQGFLAVEGSSFGENKARLFEMNVSETGGRAEKSHVLPDLGQEIEGMVSLPQANGDQTILFGGRGDEQGVGKIFWANLNERDGLTFSPEGRTGKAVDAPLTGEGRRSISDLAVDGKGNLWATAAVDLGDEGPFESALYQVGKLSNNSQDPVETQSHGSAASILGTKVEALAFGSDGSMFMGSDNESLGGRFEQILLA